MSRDRRKGTPIGTWGPDGPDLIHPGRPHLRVRAAQGCAKKDYRRDREPTMRVVREAGAPSERPFRIIPKGGRRNLLRIFREQRARHLTTRR